MPVFYGFTFYTQVHFNPLSITGSESGMVIIISAILFLVLLWLSFRQVNVGNYVRKGEYCMEHCGLILNLSGQGNIYT